MMKKENGFSQRALCCTLILALSAALLLTGAVRPPRRDIPLPRSLRTAAGFCRLNTAPPRPPTTLRNVPSLWS